MSKRKPKLPSPNPNRIEVPQKPGESEEERVSRSAITPSIGAAVTIQQYSRNYGSKSTILGLVPALREQIDAVKKGDLGRAEALLVAQAHTLDAIFNELAQRASLNLGEYMNVADIYLRLALKAQTQCRATLETLAEIKNPRPTAFIKQQNVGVNQQVNNNDVALNNPRAHAQAHEESVIPTNKLLEQDP